MRVVIVPDKFKGTLSAKTAAQAIARGWRKARSGDTLDLIPMSDGGDGFGQVMGSLVGARPRQCSTVDAAHRRCSATWWWDPESRKAVIESARVIGLAMLPPGKYHPRELDTFGLGTVLQAAARQVPRECVVGIGGSATNDGGFGMARALGWQFLDGFGKPITSWTHLMGLKRIIRPEQVSWPKRIRVAVDVGNPLLGPRGASRIYGPQKGLRERDFAHAESCLRRLSQVAARDLPSRDKETPLSQVPGSGAAGGLGFGLLAFAGAKFEPGFELFSRLCQLETRLRKADLVITGEGAVDRSTLMGKGAGQVAFLCRELKIPCICLAGSVLARRTNSPFKRMLGLTDIAPLAEAQANAAELLEKLATIAAGECSST